MKKIKVEYEVYEYKELSKEIQEKVKASYYEDEDYSYLEEDLGYKLEELLKKNKIKGEAKLFYSLSYSQGDGVCFEGNFEWKGKNISIEHKGNYYHSNSVDISITDKNDEYTEKYDEEFKVIYHKICSEIEKSGYAILEDRMNDNEFQELCEANGYTYLKDGKQVN